jgi:uncharacterized protein (TIGR03437 family)
MVWLGLKMRAACRGRATVFAAGALALSMAPVLRAQQLYSGTFVSHQFEVTTSGCGLDSTPQDFTSTLATFSRSFKADAIVCSYAAAAGTSTIQGHVDMGYPSTTPNAVVVLDTNQATGTVQFQTPLVLQTNASGFFILGVSGWYANSSVSGVASDPCASVGGPSVIEPKGSSLFTDSRPCSVNTTFTGNFDQNVITGDSSFDIVIYTFMQAGLQYPNNSGSNPHTNVSVNIRSTYHFTPIVTNPVPQINKNGVVNAASGVPKVAPGSLATIFGSNLAPSNAFGNSPLTTTLGGTSVTIGGHAAPLLYVSATQINCQVPFEVPTGAADVIVTNAGQTSNTVSVTVGDYAVGVFTYARTSSAVDPVVTHANYQLVTPANPALPNEALIVYATGIGKLTDRPSTGAATPSSPLATAWDEPAVTVGGSPAQVLFAGLAPSFVGLAQFNIQLPESLPAGNLPILIESPGNDSSPPVTLAVGSRPTQPTLSLSTTALAFGNVPNGQTKDLTLTVSNQGNTLLAVNSVTSSSGLFTVTSATTFNVQTDGSATVTVRFSPKSIGPQSGTLTIASNDPAHSSVAISLGGSGVALPKSITLAVDGGTFNSAVGYPNSAKATFLNRLTPPSYPATLTTVEIFFGQRSDGLAANAPFTLLVETNPSGSASISPSTAGVTNLYSTTVGALGAFNYYNLPTPITITSGDFVVGFQVNNAAGVYPADEDRASKSQGRSYVSSDGVTYSVIDTFPGLAGNLGIRAVVSVGGSGGN